jgi:formylglycine-generating enzyme required for sulfatase activity
MSAKIFSVGSVFEKVLREFEAGGFTYTDVLFHLRRLLDSGESPDAPSELLEVVQRRERVEPLPEYAHIKILGLINEEIARRAVEADASAAADPTADSVTGAAAAPRSESASGTAAAADRTPKAESDSQSAASAAKSLAERLAWQNAAYQALTHSHERSKDAESSAVRRATALATELADAGAALAETRTALASARGKARDYAKALAERTEAAEAARGRLESTRHEADSHQAEARKLRNLLTARDATLVDALHSLGERDAQLVALQQEQARIVPTLEARATSSEQLEAELRAALTRTEALEAELLAVRTALESARGMAQELDESLAESYAAADAARTRTDALQQESARHQADVREARAHADALALQRTSEQEIAAAREARLQRAESNLIAVQEELEAVRAQSNAYRAALQTRQIDAQVVGAEAIEVDPVEPVKPGAAFTPPAGSGRRTPAGPIGRAVWLSVAVLLLTAVGWIFLPHHSTRATPVPATAPVPSPDAVGAVIRDCPTCPAMTVLPAGKFKQGASRAEGAVSFETPLHWVIIGRPFAMSTNTVTVDQFDQFIAATGRDMKGCDTYDGEWKTRPESSWRNPGFDQTGDHPVTCVSWDDAKAYADWLSSKTGHRYRLPSASEWEFAARAGGADVRPWSADGAGACADANVADASAARRYPGLTAFACDDRFVHTAPVGSFKASAFGLNDMLGNVFQWTEDCWHADYVGAPIDGSARIDGDCSKHELRGGSWFSAPEHVRANYRNAFAADHRTSSAGIRLVRDLQQ